MTVTPDAVDRVMRAIEYVEEHLSGPVRVADMAVAACYSEYHFIRLFNRIVRQSPYDYAMRRRVSSSARAVLAGDGTILDIALDNGFQSPEGYSRAFRRVFGVAPSQARANGGIDPRRVTPKPSRSLLEVLVLCRNDGIRTIPERISLQVRGWTAATPEAAFRRMKTDSDTIGRLGLFAPDAPGGEWQAFAEGRGRLHAEVPSGDYRLIRFAGHTEMLALLIEAADFAFRFTEPDAGPFESLYLIHEDREWSLLLPDGGP